jgi:type IV secretion system protein VirB4
VFATQEVADALRNPLLQSTILSACATKIFLADPEAMTPAMSSDYAKLGLTPDEIRTLSQMAKKRDYYLRSTAGRRIFQLGLGPAQLAFSGMSSESDQRFLDRMVATRTPDEYAEAMLEHRGVEWAVAALRQQRSTRFQPSTDRKPFQEQSRSLPT